MEDRKLLKLVYALFLGVLLALFVGVGINTLYTEPKLPEYPATLNGYYGKEPTAEQMRLQQQWDKDIAAHNKKMQPYNRNVSMLALGAAVGFLIISVLFEKHIKVLSDGTLIGGLLTLLYSIGRGFASENSKFLFITISVGLMIVTYIGYRQFIRSDAAPAATHI